MKIFVSVVVSVLLCHASLSAQHWPSFRGLRASGVADGQRPPVEWDVEKSINVVWKTAIPGLSHASPVIWGDRVFIATAVSDGDAEFRYGAGLSQGAGETVKDQRRFSWRLYALDKNTGRVLWERTAHEGSSWLTLNVTSSAT